MEKCISNPEGKSLLFDNHLGCTYSLYNRVYTVYTLYKLLTAHPTGLNFCTLCTLLLEHSRMFQNPNHSFVYETSPTIRWLEEEKEKENCHLLTTSSRTDKGRGKKYSHRKQTTIVALNTLSLIKRYSHNVFCFSFFLLYWLTYSYI